VIFPDLSEGEKPAQAAGRPGVSWSTSGEGHLFIVHFIQCIPYCP
jgi:hypothetical protein